MNEQQQNTTQYMSNNQAYAIGSALQMRLDTTEILAKIESFLRGGYYTIIEDEKGKKELKLIKQGIPKANEEGIQSIVNWLTAIINPQVVQGNFEPDQYDQYVLDVNIALVESLTTNSQRWNIIDDNIDYICNFIMFLVSPFVSRTIDNKERDSYTNTMRTSENTSISTPDNRGFFGFKTGG